MNSKFDELTKAMARSVTRREAFRRFGLGLAGALAASVGLGRTSGAHAPRGKCVAFPTLGGGVHNAYYTGVCFDPNTCQHGLSSNCPNGGKAQITSSACGGVPLSSKGCSF